MKACFFDLDGTLLDTLADIGGACNAVLAAHGYPVHPVSAYRRMVGNGFPILMRRALPESVVAQGPQERLDALTEEGRRYYAAHLSIRTTSYPGLVAALGRLQDAGLRLAVLSNKPEDLTCALVPLHFPGIRFDAVRGGRHDAPLKPDPTVLLQMAASMGVAPQDCAYVGDSEVDIATARNAHLPCFSVDWGTRTREVLEAHGAVSISHTPEELLRALHGHGVKTAIVSTKRGDTIQYIMERYHLLDQLEFVIGSEDVHAPKPDPQGLNMALERMGLKPEELLFCGDTVLDAGAAKNAGFCAVLNGTTPAGDFADFHPVHIAPDLFELRQWLEG